MFNPFQSIDWHPDPSALRRFGRSLLFSGLGSLVLFSAIRVSLSPWRHLASLQVTACIIAALGGVCVVAPYPIGRAIHGGWFAFACTISMAVTNVLLAAVYFTVFLITAVFLRLSGRDPLRLRRKNADRSMWIPHQTEDKPWRYYRQY